MVDSQYNERNALYPSVSKRKLLELTLAAVTSVALLPKQVLASSSRVIDISTLTGVDPSGKTDSSVAIQNALHTLQGLGGGQLYVPPGLYQIATGLTFNGDASLSVQGCGQTESVFIITQALTILTVNQSSTANSFTIKDVGFACLVPTTGGTALQITGNGMGTTQNCLIEDVDFSVVRAGYTAFANAIVLSSLFRVNVRNVNFHGNITNGGVFAVINACIDIRFNNCSIDITGTAFLVTAYTEGLHIIDTIVANTDTAISTGSAPFYTTGGNAYVNVLGLYVSGCEFNCKTGSANLSYVSTGWIADTHFTTGNYAYAALSLLGCLFVQVANCGFTGAFDPNSPQSWTGVTIAGINGWSSVANALSNCSFQNLGLGILIGNGAFDNTIIGLTMHYMTALIGNPVSAGSFTVATYKDNSQNTTNEVQTVASQAGTVYTTNRLLYSH